MGILSRYNDDEKPEPDGLTMPLILRGSMDEPRKKQKGDGLTQPLILRGDIDQPINEPD